MTSHPDITFTSTGGNLSVTNAYFEMTILTSFTSLQVFGEFQNTTADTLCIPLADVTIGGVAIIAVGNGPAYDLGSSSVSSACIPPGEYGIFTGIENDVPATLIDGATTFEYEISGLVRNDAVPHAGAPTVTSATVIPKFSGYAVSGELQAGVLAIYNLGIDFYIRDTSGLIRGELSDFPGDLGDIAPGAVLPYETLSIDGEFDQWVQYSSFITGSSTAALQAQSLPDEPDLVGERVARHEQARKAYLSAVAASKQQ